MHPYPVGQPRRLGTEYFWPRVLESGPGISSICNWHPLLVNVIQRITSSKTPHLNVKSRADSKWHMENVQPFIVKMPNHSTAPESAFL